MCSHYELQMKSFDHLMYLSASLNTAIMIVYLHANMEFWSVTGQQKHIRPNQKKTLMATCQYNNTTSDFIMDHSKYSRGSQLSTHTTSRNTDYIQLYLLFRTTYHIVFTCMWRNTVCSICVIYRCISLQTDTYHWSNINNCSLDMNLVYYVFKGKIPA